MYNWWCVYHSKYLSTSCWSLWRLVKARTLFLFIAPAPLETPDPWLHGLVFCLRVPLALTPPSHLAHPAHPAHPAHLVSHNLVEGQGKGKGGEKHAIARPGRPQGAVQAWIGPPRPWAHFNSHANPSHSFVFPLLFVSSSINHSTLCGHWTLQTHNPVGPYACFLSFLPPRHRV